MAATSPAMTILELETSKTISMNDHFTRVTLKTLLLSLIRRL